MRRTKLTIKGRLDTLNTMINANRAGPYAGAKVKRDNDARVRAAIEEQLAGVHIEGPVKVKIIWYEANRKRDPDNIASAKKFILDALVRAGVLENDTHRYISEFSDKFKFDKDNPRIEVTLYER